MAKIQDFLSFLDSSPSPYHTVQSVKQRLEKAEFTPIKERDSWSSTLEPGGKYYLTRNGSSIVAFAIGKKWRPGNPISMIGAHTDSPCLRIKPISKKQTDGFLQVGAETYGGGLWHTWFDRDLSLAGRVMLKTERGIEQKLVMVDRPLLRIPSLAVHLDRQTPFEFNKETQLLPIAGLVADELDNLDQSNVAEGNKNSKEPDAKTESDKAPLKALTERHHAPIVELIAEEVKEEPSAILDIDCVLYDSQKAVLGGLREELVFSARLDNLGMSFCSTLGLIDSVSAPEALENDRTIRLIALFDHEEVGSESAQGAESNLLPAVLRRLSTLPPSNFAIPKSDDTYEKVPTSEDVATLYEQSLAKSFLISADMAHSVHPNYAGKYETDHRPHMNKGTVIKVNANQRYMTNSPGIVLLQELAQKARSGSVPLQLFVVRNDSMCGSTIGPMLASSLGSRTLDLGNAQLSMHSIRETGGAADVDYSVRLFESFFDHYGTIEKQILVD
ncbi:MAG: hypothetical protein M1831_003913 [Alyxoria varia]|nr:MAG: hypothetical protein M1831_003913 [Alyxoria varia]